MRLRQLRRLDLVREDERGRSGCAVSLGGDALGYHGSGGRSAQRWEFSAACELPANGYDEGRMKKRFLSASTRLKHASRWGLGGLGALVLCSVMAVPAQASCPVDLVFVIDVTASMEKTDPSDQVAKTVESVASAMGVEARVGVVTFGEQAEVLAPLAGVDQQVALVLSDTLRKVRVKGRRGDIRAGLDTAWQMLQAKHVPGRSGAIVVFADDDLKVKGRRNATTEAREFLLTTLTSQLKEHRVQVFGIALDEKAQSLLGALGHKTGGRYIRPLDLKELPALVTTHARGLCPTVKGKMAPRAR